MSDGQDVQSTLEDMDRKLRELQRELAMVAAPPEIGRASCRERV
jgi:hypothetical protein